MLTPDEEKFITFWEANREKQKKWTRKLSIGLPASTVFVILIFINFFSGWYKRAQMMINADHSLILILLIAGIGIVLFYTIFSVRHRWEMNEQQYEELMARKEKQDGGAA
jgi:uncharacterized membrane protein